jgi:hypothetical protein
MISFTIPIQEIHAIVLQMIVSVRFLNCRDMMKMLSSKRRSNPMAIHMGQCFDQIYEVPLSIDHSIQPETS